MSFVPACSIPFSSTNYRRAVRRREAALFVSSTMLRIQGSFAVYRCLMKAREGEAELAAASGCRAVASRRSPLPGPITILPASSITRMRGPDLRLSAGCHTRIMRRS